MVLLIIILTNAGKHSLNKITLDVQGSKYIFANV
jgi:hypothetical protein